MKEKRIITYRKNGEEIKKEFNIFTRKEILKNLFEEPYYQSGTKEIYRIKSDIEYLEISNISFKKETTFVIPNDTMLVLEDCSFTAGRIGFENGLIQLINPRLNPSIYTNIIHASSVEDLDIVIGKDNRSFITITGDAKNFSINARERIETISITGEKAHLKNIKGIKNIKLTNKETILENCNLELDLETSIQKINAETVNANNCSLYYQTNFKNLPDSEKRKKNYLNNYNALNEIIYADNLNLTNTAIDTNNILNMSAKRITMDEHSYIKANNKIKISNDIFIAQDNNIKITPTTVKQTNEKRQVISILKGIRDQFDKDSVIEVQSKQKAKKLTK